MARHETGIMSDRLQRVLCLLLAAKGKGVSSRELMLEAEINRASDAIYDLTKNGVAVASRWEKSKRGKVYKRYWLVPFQPVDAEITRKEKAA